MSTKDPKQRIEYNYKKFGDDVELIQSNQFKFCLKQCFKMAFYISKLYEVEVLRMQCEFLKDDNKTIWFSHASQIVYRRIINKLDEQQATKQISYINKEHQAQLVKQLEEHRIA